MGAIDIAKEIIADKNGVKLHTPSIMVHLSKFDVCLGYYVDGDETSWVINSVNNGRSCS